MKVIVEYDLKWLPYKGSTTQWYLDDPLRLTQQSGVRTSEGKWSGFLMFYNPKTKPLATTAYKAGFSTKEEAFAWCEAEWLKEWNKQ